MIKMESSKQDDNYASHVHKEHLLEEDDIENRSSNAMPEILRQLTPKEYKKVGDKATLKMDIIIVPCLMLMYILNYLDRNNIASAKLANISEDLDLTPTEYQSCISILFVGYSECFMPPHKFRTILIVRHSPNDGAFEYDAGKVQVAWSLHMYCNVHMGRNIGSADCGPRLYQPGHCAVLHRVRGSRVLSWGPVLPLTLLQPQAIRFSRRSFLLWFPTG